jgi:hypothetical protein
VPHSRHQSPLTPHRHALGHGLHAQDHIVCCICKKKTHQAVGCTTYLDTEAGCKERESCSVGSLPCPLFDWSAHWSSRFRIMRGQFASREKPRWLSFVRSCTGVVVGVLLSKQNAQWLDWPRPREKMNHLSGVMSPTITPPQTYLAIWKKPYLAWPHRKVR